MAGIAVGSVPPAGADHAVTLADGLVDSRCDNHSCTQVRVDDEVAQGGNPFNQIDTIEVPGNAGLGLPDRLVWGGNSVCVEDFVAPGCAAGGDITEVVAGDGLTGGATFGSATLGIAPGGVATAMLADASVTTAKLADGAVVTLKLADGSVVTAKLADVSVTTSKIADDAVDAVKLKDSATVDADRAVTTNHIRDVAVTGAKIAAGAVGGAQLADGAVVTLKLADGSIVTAKLADAVVTTAKLADGSVTSLKILDGTIALGDLGFDPATQAELDTHKASGDHDGRYFTESELQTAGTINSAGNPVDWTKLKGVPAGFADGVDADSGGDITAVNAGSGMTGGGTSGDATLSVDTAVIQQRVTGSCAVGSAIRAINADGTVTCGSVPAQMVSGSSSDNAPGTGFGPPMDITQNLGTEASAEMLVTRSATIENFRARMENIKDSGATTEITVRKNRADTAISVSFVAGDAAGTQKTDGDTVTLAPGDRIAIKVVNSGSAGGAPFTWAFDLA